MMPSNRDGFTLAELLVVAVVGVLIIGAMAGAMITGQRITTVQAAEVQGAQTMRAGLDILFSEFREVSARGGDVLAIGPDSIKIRVMRNFGLVCSINLASKSAIVRQSGEWFSDGDSIYVFADNDPLFRSDDRWLIGAATTVDTTATCPGGAAAQSIQMAGVSFAVDTVRNGAPMRSYVHYTYGLFEKYGRSYVGRRTAAGVVEPLVGEVRNRANKGVEFQFFDEFNNVTTDPTAVRQVGVTLRSQSQVRRPNGTIVGDSISARVNMRN